MYSDKHFIASPLAYFSLALDNERQADFSGPNFLNFNTTIAYTTNPCGIQEVGGLLGKT